MERLILVLQGLVLGLRGVRKAALLAVVEGLKEAQRDTEYLQKDIDKCDQDKALLRDNVTLLRNERDGLASELKQRDIALMQASKLLMEEQELRAAFRRIWAGHPEGC